MFERILSHIAEHGAVRLTELSRSFELPPSMAANLVIQLEDAGFIEECENPKSCGHSESCGGCGSDRGGCHLDPPYCITEAGRAFLARET